MERKPLQKLNAKHEIFIREMIQHGNKTKAYKKAYPDSSSKSAKANGSALSADPLIAARINASEQRMLEQTESGCISLVKEQMTNIHGIQQILTDIVSGEMKFDKMYREKDGVTTKTVKAGAREVLNALGLNVKILKEIPGGKINKVFEILITDKKTGEVKPF